jgi:hypothetical protein
MTLGYLLLRLAQRRRGSKRFRGGLACHPARQTEIGTMAGVAAFGAVAVGFTALAGSGGDGAAPEITDACQLAEQTAFLGFQLRQRVIHGRASFLSV